MDKIFSVGVKGPSGCKPIMQQFPAKAGQNMTWPYFNPPLYHDFYTKLSPTELAERPMPHFLYWSPSKFKFKTCDQNKTAFFPSSDAVAKELTESFKQRSLVIHPLAFRIRKDGAFLYQNQAEQKCNVNEDPKSVMCIDGIQDYGLYGASEFQNTEDEYVVHLCRDWNIKKDEKETVTRNYQTNNMVLIKQLSN
jgi:hypothetical protein